MRRTYQKKTFMYFVVFILFLLIGVAYASLHQDLVINGTTKIASNTWGVHFESINVTNGSVPINTTAYASASPATINPSKMSEISFNVLLQLPGDYYEFTVNAVNSGSIDAMIDSISSTIKIGEAAAVEISSSTLPAYLDYSATYSDGVALAAKQILAAGATESLRIKVEFKDSTNVGDLPSSPQNLQINIQVNYVQSDSTSIAVPHPTFADDSWATIVSNVQNNTIPSYYTVGSTKEVDLGTIGTHMLRIANTSTPSECSTNGFSQTACGFVLEFADIITTHQMNPYNSSDTTTNGVNNKGGWEYSDMRAYLNSGKYLEGTASEIDYTSGGIYNALPTALKNAIINTTVVSGHGSLDSTNFTTTDKLYLLSTKEVWGKEGTSDVINYDTAEAETRQLDYYKAQNVTTANETGAIKQNSGSNSSWWLRSARSNRNTDFFYVYNTGGWTNNSSGGGCGVSPAFRIG